MEAQQKIIITIPPTYNQTLRNQIANDLIEVIINRTLSGLDRYGNPFKPYKKSYYTDKRFIAAGKERSGVNLRYTRDMLNGLRLLSQGVGFITLGYTPGRNNDKAYWNMEYREFLGVSKRELDNVLKRYPQNVDPILIGIAAGAIDRIYREQEESEEDNGN